MGLTEREIQILTEIEKWSEQMQYEQTDFEITYDKWLENSLSLIPENVRTEFFSKLDNWLFHLHAILQGTQIQVDARERLIRSARVFNQDIDDISDLKELTIDQLIYLTENQIAKHRLYSFAQGGLSGTGGLLLLGTDIPGITVLNLRIVQLIAMTYGYEVNTPYEMMTSLKVFHAATLPKRMRFQGWEELTQGADGYTQNQYFYNGSEDLTDETWLELPLKHIVKAVAISVLRKRMIQGIPLVSMAIGAGMNYQLTRQVSDYAHNYYRLRFLKEKEY
ncbi:EcsC family protein [Fredinandcohnia salidurans]|uniref:EcsC family protein n=1 Tax=Fredinandcohnia salidurans TaxID=2595041 RepID=A0ABW4MPL6_9BACI|nr:EcsC family protein [Fredinandcohnia onubensis]